MIHEVTLDPKDIIEGRYTAGVNVPIRIRLTHRPTGHTAEATGSHIEAKARALAELERKVAKDD